MKYDTPIPNFALFGEHNGFPDVVHCEAIHARAHLHDWVIPPHRHSQMAQIFQIVSGAAKTQVDGTVGVLKTQELLYIPAHVVHGFEFDQGTQGQVLSLPLPIMTAFHHHPSQVLSQPITGPFGANLSPLFQQFSQAFQSTGTYRTQRLIGLSHVMLSHIAEIGAHTHTKTSHTHKTLDRFDQLIAQHLSEAWRPSDFADSLAITTGHLGRICRQATGKSASSYIDAAVMTEASRLLAFTRLSVAEIGYRLGYTDPPYFSRRFRKICGKTPSAYRAQFITDSTSAN